ncbi:MAG: hypothetical protein L0Y66_25525 [Myxococcaceae bacterium]|nr:hypothetical protein [Myxococcaceae bacterium]MCI0669386.1 hypothetical protein [Myxococcaceae bacterium]
MLAAAAMLVLGAAPLTWEAGLYTEARARSFPDAPLQVWAGDVELDPRVALEVRPGVWQLSGRYMPRLSMMTASGEAFPLEVLHRAQLEALWRPHPSWTVRLEQGGAVGRNDLSRLVAPEVGGGDGAPGPVERLPAVVLPYKELESRLSVSVATSARLRLMASVGFGLDGGVGAAGRSVLPERRQVEVRGVAEASLSAQDALEVSVEASRVQLIPGPEGPQVAPPSTGVSALGVWERRLGSSTQLRLGAGGGAVRTVGVEVLAEGLAELAHTVPLPTASLSGTVGVRYAPYVDRLLGAVYGRVEGSAELAWQGPRVGVALRAEVARGMGDGVAASTYGGLVVSASWALSASLGLSGGVRSALQPVPAAGGQAPTSRMENVAFLAFSSTWSGGADR